MSAPQAPLVGIIGGSGFYRLMDDFEQVVVETPYGAASSAVFVGKVKDVPVAFLPRHGTGHTLPPHMINYRANLWALESLGAARIVSACAAGSLQPGVHPGDLVICDQLVDRTRNRKDTYFDGPSTVHVSLADPFCPELRSLIRGSAADGGMSVHAGGTMVVIEGPRFSTRAESAFFSGQGWHAVTMTQYPEAALARELGICFSTVALITDYDAGVQGERPVSASAAMEVFKQNTDRLKGLLLGLVPRIPAHRSCDCAGALDSARVN